MTLRVSTVVLDVADMKRAIAFWTAALRYEAADASDAWTTLRDPAGAGTALGLQPNGERKADVNRVHLDLEAADPPAEVARLLRLGATRVPWDYAPGATHTVLADPEGNEFCIVPR
jgi:catechol 2,3-dioxygenase-like lactoylglutathione lyase family enzyme